MKLVGVDEKGRPIVAELLPNATPRPPDAADEDPGPPHELRLGKILFGAAVALITGILIASGINAADVSVTCHPVWWR